MSISNLEGGIHHDRVKSAIICSYTPYFLSRDVLWFDQNIKKIAEAVLNSDWWRSNILILSMGLNIGVTGLIKKMVEMGYERTRTKILPGQFSQKGESVEIFPVNSLEPITVVFFGNLIEDIAVQKKETIVASLRKKILSPQIKKSEFSELRFLRPGDYITHQDHGIGIFGGFKIINEKKYYEIQYASPRDSHMRPDLLFVPEDMQKKISPYFGFQKPQIHRLGSLTWKNTKKKVKEDVIRLAKELSLLYAQREAVRRIPYEKDDVMQAEFEQSFEFIETEDQLRAIQATKKDMESSRPMDRLIVGDVGFGKTEVALRAAFKAASQGRQVALLCPTTILADQHYNNLKKRLGNIPLNIALLSRFESAANQKKSIAKIKEGTADIIVGTHRILSKDIQFKSLGLLIIDEEQKFGVRQKEKMKKFHNNIDILSLSATPIPRSLYMAMSSIREMSHISTPPPNRKSIETIIAPYDQKMLEENLEQEKKRGGQIYFLHNKIQSMERSYSEIKKIAPKITIRMAHSRIPENELRIIMNDFQAKKFDLLLSTTIIENGLDLPNVNLLIVENAANLGLAQAYQIRGRIGRSEKKAKAIFFYNRKKLSEKAEMRLDALKEAEALGSGYFIAKKDLEIRGAGNILGKEQSGNMNKVGFNIYCQMLAEATEQLREKNQPRVSV